VYCAERRTKPAPSGATPYLGPQFDERNVLAAVKQAGLTARRSKDAAREAADMIADGNIVGWFQGRMEFGPRALGNRSLLADPRRPDTRPILNRMVKRREDFRPFAPSVLAERANEWFDIGSHLASHEYMLFACPTKAGRHERIPAVLHHDGTARVQLVRREANPRFHELISRFFDRTGVRSFSTPRSTTASRSSARLPTRSPRSARLASTRCLWATSALPRRPEPSFDDSSRRRNMKHCSLGASDVDIRGYGLVP
jgi:carbamoyltransferase